MKWNDVSRIMNGSIPNASPLPEVLDYSAVSLDVIGQFADILHRNFRNMTEMEAIIQVAIVTVFAVKGLDVTVQLQPSLSSHPTFLFVVRNGTSMKGFIEVKKVEVFTSLGEKTDCTAQCLREAQIALFNGDVQAIPFIATNSRVWSFGVAKKDSAGKICVKKIYDDIFVKTLDVKVIKYVRALLTGSFELS